ncbi:MAG TPA: response regulator, partial [Methanomassiliicoccales archaeon]|nr:response regulator [Methanomassiliicoccales archaeon]
MTDAELIILALEDSPSDYELLRRELRRSGLKHQLVWAQDKRSFLDSLKKRPDLFLMDYTVPGFEGLEAMHTVRGSMPHLPVIIVSGAIGEEVATEALKAGATDYVLKSQLSRLRPVIERAMKEAEQLALRDRAERELEETKGRMEALVSQMPVGVMVVDADSLDLTFINQEARRLLGVDRPSGGEDASDLLSRIPFYNEMGMPIPNRERPVMISVHEGRAVHNVPITIERADGTRFPAHVSAAPVRNREGRIVSAVSMITDVSEMTGMQRQLEEQGEELARSNAELQNFAYMASHDMQEPLRMISAYLSLLQKRAGDKLGPKEKEYVAIAVEGALRMRDMIDDLLTYSRVQTADRPHTSVDMDQVLANAAKNLSTTLSSNNALLHTEPLPTVNGDAIQLTQLLQNLIGNAVKFHGADPPEVWVGCDDGGAEWVCWVRDNGIGIAPKYHESIFEMFQR